MADEHIIGVVDATCGNCGHHKMHHIGGACAACVFMHRPTICTKIYTSALPVALIEQAVKVDPTSYPQEMPCRLCGELWMTHNGMLCPNMATLFEPMLSESDAAFISG